jgi:predicted dehydrogenase
MRVCVIGYGNIAKKHIEAFRAHGFEIVASCNRSESSNEAARLESGIPKTYTDHIRMIETEKPDAVVNCVSFEHIYSITKSLIPYGIPLLIEKPAGLTVFETKELINLEKQFSTKVQVALNRRHYSVIQKALDSIGGVEHLDMMSIEWSERPLATKNKKGFTDLLIAQHIYANSIHGIDTLNYFSGGINDYQTYCSASEGYFHWQMAFSGKSDKGVITNFTSSWGSPVPWRILMYGKGKRIEFAPLETCKVFDEQTKGFSNIEPEAFDLQYKAGFYLQTKSFLDLVHANNLAHKHSLESTLNSMKIAEEIFKKLYVDR